MLFRNAGLLCVCLLLSVLSWSQRPNKEQASAKADPAPSTKQTDGADERYKHLTRVETVTSPAEFANLFVPPLHCDGDGNIYYQTNPAAPAIHKLNTKGERVAVYQASANPNLKVDLSGSFAIAANGDVYELIFAHEINRYVFVYSADGTLKSTIKLQPGFAWMPKALQVFANGTMLVTGAEYDKDPTATMWPFTGIFDTNGRLLKEIKLEDDDTLHDMAASGDARVTNPLAPRSNRAVDMTRIQMGADGNAYLMRWTNPALVYVISAGGEVLRRFVVEPEGAGYKPIATQVVQNRMAIFFYNTQNGEKLMKVVDLEGHVIETYDEHRVKGKAVGDPIGTAFVCYTQNPERFTFLGSTDDGKLQFWISEPR